MPSTTTRRYYANFAPQQTLSAPITNSDVALTIAGSFSGWPVQFPFSAVINYGKTDQEIVDVTAIVGATATITRGVDSSTAQAHSAGATLDAAFIRRDMDEANAHSSATANVHGVAGNVVGDTDAQTLTNKTLTAPNVNDPVLKKAGNTLTLPTGPDTLVGRASTDTLTNKTLTSPAVNGGVLDAASTIGGLSGTDLGLLPKGRVASGSTATSKTVTTSETFITALADLSFTAVVGRRYKVTFSVPGVPSSSAATNQFTVNIRDGGGSAPTTSSTLLLQTPIYCGTTDGNSRSGGTWVWELTGLSAGVHHLGLTVQASAGGTNSIGAGATFPIYLLIEDIGT